MAWTFVVCDRLGTPLGELRNARDRSLRFVLNRVPTFGFVIDVDNPRTPDLLQLDKRLVKGYDDQTGSKVLRMLGPGVTYEKVRRAGDGTIAMTYGGIGWRLATRLIGQAAAGAVFGTAVTPVDRGTILGGIVSALNTGDASSIYTQAGDTGIRLGVITPSSSAFAGPYRYVPAEQVFTEMSAPLDGPDWEIAPVEPVADAQGVQLGQLNVLPFIGALQPNAIWEFGFGRSNVAEWRDVGDASALANRAVHLPPGYPENSVQLPLVASDAASIADRGLYETVIGAEVQTDQLRQALITEHVRIRKVPRRVISFTPIAEDPAGTPRSERRVPRLFDDFSLGDIVRFRAVEKFGVRDNGTGIGYRDVQTVDVFARVWAATLSLDDAGVATPTLTLVEEAS